MVITGRGQGFDGHMVMSGCCRSKAYWSRETQGHGGCKEYIGFKEGEVIRSAEEATGSGRGRRLHVQVVGGGRRL